MNALKDPRRRHLVVLAAIALAANAAALVGGPAELTFAAGYVLACVVPGYLLVMTAFPHRSAMDSVERSVLSIGLGYVALILGGLVVHFLPGPITPVLVVLTFDALALALIVAAYARGAWADAEGARGVSADPLPREVLVHVALLLVVGLAFRLPWLGYSQVQGDEATILLKAAAAVEGRADALFVHKKGPAEIVIPTVFYGLSGSMDETVARLPFALAMVAGFIGLYQLARAMFGPAVGLVAGLLLAINGFFVGFGRVIQYQALVFLLSVLALLCAYRLYQDRAPPRTFLFLAVSFVGVGLLAQYDIVFVVPAAAFLVLLRWRDHPPKIARDLGVALAAGVLSLAVLLAYFVPWSRHPYFHEATLPYLFGVRVGGEGGHLHNTLGNSLLLSTFYNSTYYMAFMALTLVAGIAHHLWRTGARERAGGPRRESPQLTGAVLTAVFVICSVLLVAAPDAWQVGNVNLSFFFMAGVVLVLLVSPSPTREWKAQLLWFAAGFIFYATVVKSPRTHFHVAFPAWSVLSACALRELWVRLPSVAWKRLAIAGFAALFAVFAFYPYLVFLQHDVEYKRTFPASRPPGYWTLTDDLPTNGWFGFPYRAGWKAVGTLFEEGVLYGTYFSNEEEKITNWYTRGAARCDADPRYYFIADGVQDERPVPSDMAAAGYREIAQVTVGARTRMRVYERAAAPGGGEGVPPMAAAAADGLGESSAGSAAGASKEQHGSQESPAGAVQLYRAEDLAPVFDSEHSGSAFEPLLPYGNATGYVDQPLVTEQEPDGVVFGDRAGLIGYSLARRQLEPGDEVLLTLYWRGAQPMDKDYSVFVHLTDEGGETTTHAQSDGAPGVCGKLVPTSTWQPGRVVLDRRVLVLPRDIAEGTYALRVGLYDYETLERLPITRHAGASGVATEAGSSPAGGGPVMEPEYAFVVDTIQVESGP